MNLKDLIAQLRAQIAVKLEERNGIAAELAELRDANTTDEAKVAELRSSKDALDADIDAVTARVADLEGELARDEAAERLQTEVHPTGTSRTGIAPANVRVGQEPRTYSPGTEREGVSFLRDVMNAQTRGDFVAAERLGQHMREERVERAHALAGVQSRDVGTGAFTGLTVPQYLTDLVAPEIKAMRPFADICRKHPLPADGMTVNISRITTSSAAAVQATEAAGVQETDMDDTLLTVNVRTIAGQQDVSRQAIDRGTGIDAIVVQDLIGEYHTTLDNGILNDDGTSGTHLGVRNVSGNVGVTYTDADPTAAELYPKLADLVQQIQSATNNGLSHFVMHPRRWWWLASSLGTSFPLLTVPMAGTQQAGTLGETGYAAMGASILGARVILDRNIPTNTGAGTVDPILGVDASECHLWEDSGAPLLIRAEQTGAGNLLVKFVVYGYSAFTAGRYPLATGDVTGTGLAAPAF